MPLIFTERKIRQDFFWIGHFFTKSSNGSVPDLRWTMLARARFETQADKMSVCLLLCVEQLSINSNSLLQYDTFIEFRQDSGPSCRAHALSFLGMFHQIFYSVRQCCRVFGGNQ